LGASTGEWLACTNSRTLSVADVYQWAGKARVTGFAPIGSVGQIVTIIAGWNHKVLGTAKVLGDNSFRATVQLPPASLRSSLTRGTYRAKLGSKVSAPLAFARRLYNTRIQIRFVKEKVTTFKFVKVNGKLRRVKVVKYVSAQTITFVGTVTGPFVKPGQQVIIRGANTCAQVAHGPILARAKVNALGRFNVTFTLPKSLLHHYVIFVRAQDLVAQQPPRGKKAYAGKPTPVEVYGITRGVRVF
jgi:hypothetical protein